MDEQDVIQERLKLLSDYTNDLLELQNVDLTTYTENKLIRRTVERTLHLAWVSSNGDWAILTPLHRP